MRPTARRRAPWSSDGDFAERPDDRLQSEAVRPIALGVAAEHREHPRRRLTASFVGQACERAHHVVDVGVVSSGAMKDRNGLVRAAFGEHVHRVGRRFRVVAIVSLGGIASRIQHRWTRSIAIPRRLATPRRTISAASGNGRSVFTRRATARVLAVA